MKKKERSEKKQEDIFSCPNENLARMFRFSCQTIGELVPYRVTEARYK